MKQKTNKQAAETLAFEIVAKAKSTYGFSNYYQIESDYFVLQSMIDDFKQRYVYNTKEYQETKSLYRKGLTPWLKLDAVSIRLFKEQLKALENAEVDAFFGIVRTKKERLKQIKKEMALAS